jgi:hypothetical protein
MMDALTAWFSTHEYIAIWLEGVALVAIFIWDRLDSRADHKQMLAQLKIAQDQAAASQAAAQSVINAERAWVMAELGWYERSGLHIAEGTSQSRTEGRTETTSAMLKLTCKNEGRSPAWIDNVYAHMEILSKVANLPEPRKRDNGRTFGPMGPLGAGKEHARVLDLTCPGHLTEGEFLSVYAIVEYRDIFDIKRETHLGYSIRSNAEIHRQDALPERNRNT